MRTSSLLQALAASIVIALTVAAPDANAETTKFAGKHSRGEIGKICKAQGGAPYNTKGSKGNYGCANFDKDSYVDCDAKGRCVGITGKTAPTATTPLMLDGSMAQFSVMKPAP